MYMCICTSSIYIIREGVVGGRDFLTRLQPELGVAIGWEGRRRMRNIETCALELMATPVEVAIDHQIEFC